VTAQAGPYDLDLATGPETLGQEFLARLDELREAEPVYWNETAACWMISRHRDVSDAFAGLYPLSNRARVTSGALALVPPEERPLRFPVLSRYLPQVIVDTDPPEHTRLRKLLVKAFTRKAVEGMRPYTRQRIESLLDKAGEGHAVEFQEEISRPIPGAVIFRMLGIPEDQFDNMRDWSNALMEVVSGIGASIDKIEKAEQALTDMFALARNEREKRLRSPGEDLITTLVNASVDGDMLTEDEFYSQMLVLIVAGHESTSSTITLITEALGRKPEAWEYLRAHPERMQQCVNELMRYVCMSAGQLRIAAEDFDWHGRKIKGGQMVVLAIAAANRDPRVFARPTELDFGRDNTESMVFGPGLHHCIGHLLAKMEVAEFLHALVSRFDRVEVLDRSLQFMPSAFFRGLRRLNVRFHPRQAG